MEREKKDKEDIMRKDVCVSEDSRVLDVLGVHDDVHDVLHVSQKNVTLYAFVEGEFSVFSNLWDSEV